MELKDAKRMFDAGVYKAAIVTRIPMSEGYILTLSGANKVSDILTGQRTKNEPRVFSSIDAAVANAQKVGFQTITVNLS